MNFVSFIKIIPFLQCVCVARGQTANDADCNGKSFKCVDPGSYVRCDVDPDDPNHSSVGESDTLVCADGTTCDDNADSPCTPNETEPEVTPSEPEAEPEPEPEQTDAPSGETTEENPSEEGSNGTEVQTPGSEVGGTDETTPENPNSNEGETSTAGNSSGDDGSEENTNSNEDETSTSGADESTPESTSASEQPTTTTATPEFTCTAVGRFPHPTDCQKYNFCWDLEHPYVTFTCKEKLVFDPLVGRCDNNWLACPNAPHCVANHQVLADENDNRFYFVCKNIGSLLMPEFTIHKKECDKHTTFDPELLVCVPNEASDSEGSDSSESDEHHEKVKFECTEAGIFADLTDETKYYECIVKNIVKGKLKTHHRSCPKDHVFSLLDMMCIPILADEPLAEQ